MNELNNLTNSIADAYLSYCGRDSNSKAFLSPQEYLMFRSQAMEELKYGLHQRKPESSQKQEPSEEKPTVPKETDIEDKTTQQTTVSYEKEDKTPGLEPENKPNNTPGIIQIPIKQANQEDMFLAAMKKIDG